MVATQAGTTGLGLALVLRYRPGPKTAVAIRAEYYMDENGVIVASTNPGGFKTSGFSANFDYNIFGNVVWRVEGKFFNSEYNIFNDKSATSNNCPIATTSLSIAF